MRIEAIYIAREHAFKGRHGQPPADEPMVRVDEVECVAGRGLRGDRYFGAEPGHRGQVTFFAREVWEDLCATFGVTDRDAGSFRRNVIVSGADLESLVGREFTVQGVRFAGVEPANPCHWMNVAFHDGAEKALAGRGGLRARILENGVLRAGK